MNGTIDGDLPSAFLSYAYLDLLSIGLIRAAIDLQQGEEKVIPPGFITAIINYNTSNPYPCTLDTASIQNGNLPQTSSLWRFVSSNINLLTSDLYYNPSASNSSVYLFNNYPATTTDPVFTPYVDDGTLYFDWLYFLSAGRSSRLNVLLLSNLPLVPHPLKIVHG